MAQSVILHAFNFFVRPEIARIEWPAFQVKSRVSVQVPALATAILVYAISGLKIAESAYGPQHFWKNEI